MSHLTNSNVNFCDVCDLSFETKNCLYRHQSYDSTHQELLEKMFGSDDDGDLSFSGAKTESAKRLQSRSPAKTEASAKTIERMYDSDDELIYKTFY